MAAPTFYLWTDPGAPKLLRGDKASTEAVFQACLIDGYGSKTPPGSGTNKWSIPFSNSTSFVLKQGGTSARKCCVKLESFEIRKCKVTAARDYTDINTPVDVFTENSTYTSWGLGFASNDTDGVPWMIIATERSMYFFCGYNSRAGQESPILDSRGDESMYLFHQFFGDYVPAYGSNIVNQMITYTDYSSTNDGYQSQNFMYANADGYGAKRLSGNPVSQTNGETLCDTMCRMLNDSFDPSYFGQKGLGTYSPAFPRGNKVLIDKFRIFAANVYAGDFPGMLVPITGPIFPPAGSYQKFAGTGAYAGQTMWQFSDAYASCWLLHDGDWGVE